MTRILSLHHLTALDVKAADLVDLAAASGCDAVCVFTHLSASHIGRFPCIESIAEATALRTRLEDTGIKVCDLEVFNITPEFVASAMRPGLERGAIIGATHATVHIRDVDEARAAESFAQFCAIAREFHILPGIEFTGFSVARTIDAAARILELSQVKNAGIAADVLHVMRNGMSIGDVARHSEAITYAQLCDGPRIQAGDDYYDEAVGNREIPGRGEFPLRQFVAALPIGTPISIEVPMHRLRDQGMTAAERVALAVGGAKQVLAAA